MPTSKTPRTTPGAAPDGAASPGDLPVAQIVVSQVEMTFGPILDQRRWVLWQQRPNRKDPAKRHKVPVVATGRRTGASSTDPTTWRTWAGVQSYLDGPDVAGPGIMLGQLSDGRWLVGVDLDLALSPATGRVEPWAQAVVDRCATYAEVSPSGAGIKLFGYACELPASLLTEDGTGRLYHKGLEGTPPDAAVPLGAESAGHKTPELGLYAERRYFTVTGRKLDGVPDQLGDITDAFADLVRMVASWGDRLQVQGPGPGATMHSAAAPSLAEPPVIVSSLLASEPELAAAWASGAKLTRGKDQSGSGFDYSLMVWLAGRGHDDATIEAALRAYPHGQIGRLDGARAHRRIKGLLREAAKCRMRAAQAREAAAWINDLIVGTNGPLDNVANVGIALAAEPAIGGTIHLDELRGCPVVASTPWRASGTYREWTDTDDIALAEWLQLRGLNAKPTTCAAAVQHFAATRPIHPLRDHLDGLCWDGQARLEHWLIAYLGVADSPYARAVGRAWMVQAVARVYRPGCKADHALILEGPQGAFKSTACAILAIAPEFFADEIADLGSKDSAQDLRGKWIIEIGELSALRRSEVERVKAFISRTVDHYRPSYGRRSQDFPRSCVFIGTTNADTYLADETGGRRFWPVKVGTVDVEGLRRDTAQLWAEAVCAFKAGEVWHLPRDLELRARDEQADRRIADPWEQAVITWAKDKPGPVTIGDALQYAIGLELERRTQADENRIARIFKAHGWERVQLRVAGERVWHYRRPPPVPAPTPTPEQSEVGRIADVFTMAGRRASPVSPVAGDASGDGKASKTAAITSVTTVTSSFGTCGVVTGKPHGVAAGTGNSAIESGNMPVTPVTLVTAAESLASPSPVARGDGALSGDGGHAWDDLDHWRYRLGRAGPSRDARQQVVLDWGSSAGGTVDTTGEQISLTLPSNLVDCYALRELKRLARDLSLIPKVLVPSSEPGTQT